MGIKDNIKSIFLKTPFSWPIIAYNAIKSHEKNRIRKGSNEYIQAVRNRQWFKDDPDSNRRFNYDLKESSVVFDLGGYKGEFASAIMNKYNCNVYIFEPIPFFYDIIVSKFSHNNKLHAYCFGLYDKTINHQISLSNNGSSLFIRNNDTLEIQLKNIVEFIDENNISHIDLMKINIEGAEYQLLESLISHKLITRFKNIQVQFHDFVIPNAKVRMHNIQQKLSQTHELTYLYEFVWENWKQKGQ